MKEWLFTHLLTPKIALWGRGLQAAVPVPGAYLVVVLCQLQHLLHDVLVELAVLAVVRQGQALHPALLVQVQQHLHASGTEVGVTT